MATGSAAAGGWPVQIVLLEAAHVPEVGALFAGSHGDYPPFRHLFPDPAQRQQVLRRFFTATVGDALALGPWTPR